MARLWQYECQNQAELLESGDGDPHLSAAAPGAGRGAAARGARWPGAPRGAQPRGDRARAARSDRRRRGAAHRPAGRGARARGPAQRVPPLRRHGFGLRGAGRAHPGQRARADCGRADLGQRRFAPAPGGGAAQCVLRGHRTVHARGRRGAPALAVPAAPALAPGARAARAAVDRAARARARAVARGRGARAAVVVRRLGPAAQRPEARARARRRRGRGGGAGARRPVARTPGSKAVSAPPLTIAGAPGSPYSRKLRAVLRYRRIPHLWVQHGSDDARHLPQPRVSLLPQLVGPSGPGGALEARIDSTPLIRALEREHPGRSVRPPDPVAAFVDSLLEDYADEWLTKAMFHYRWVYAADIAKASAILPRWRKTDQREA